MPLTAIQKFPEITWALLTALHAAFPPNRPGDSTLELLKRIGERRVLDRLTAEFENQQHCTVETNLVFQSIGAGPPDPDRSPPASSSSGAAPDTDFGQSESEAA